MAGVECASRGRYGESRAGNSTGAPSHGSARGLHGCRSSEFLAGRGIEGKRTATREFSKTFCVAISGAGNVGAEAV